MPLGIITEAEFNSELSLHSNRNEVEVIQIKHGRGNAPEVPQEIRKLIASNSIHSGGNHKEIAEAFGVSTSSVSAYKNGATSVTTYDKPNEELSRHVDKVRDTISTTARSRLMSALQSLTDEKIENTKARDAASIAKDMSVVVKNMEPVVQGNDSSVKVLIYQPRIKEESDFEVISISE